MMRNLVTGGAGFIGSPRSGGASHRELITFVADRPGHDRRYAIDVAKIRRELVRAPLESFETGIRRTVQWYLANEAWWKAIGNRYSGERLGIGSAS